MWPPCPRQGHAVGPGSDVQEGEKRCHIVFMEKSYPMNVLLAFPVIGIFSIIAALLCFKYKLFYHKAHVLVLSIIITWLLSSLLGYIFNPQQGTGLFLFFLFFPCLCLSILYILGKTLNISFSFHEYLFTFILYIPSEFIYIFIMLLFYDQLGLQL